MSFVTWDTLTHHLSVVVRIDDYFTGAPVADAFRVRAVQHEASPVRGRVGHRQGDGTYRFVDLPAGPLDIEVVDPTGRWALHGAPIAITLPLADPAVPEVRSAWPTPLSRDPAGQTRVRGRLVDASANPVPGQTVQIDVPTGAFARHAVSDGDGEFVFAITGFVPPESDGSLLLEARSGTAVTRTWLGGAAPTPGGQFRIPAGRASRLVVEVVP